MNNFDLTLKEIEGKLQYYCSYQDRCHKEVIAKLKTFGVKSNESNQIISNLIKENYLNESRFSKSFVRGKFNIKNWGKVRIINELKFRNISPYNITLGLNEIDDQDYMKKLEDIFNKKLSSLSNLSSPLKKKKIISYLLYRGWESNLVYSKINEI
ncbi:MAG: recombinase RecX [Flavobacteriaceae bacterium]|jgi:regulatory protein|nr:recombinase RecX [Flavobacteriaceae bacterium]MBT6447923.1 recombinase RecX [Flavobacteriaceae bacterium]MBT7624106.1 recombinase RecX [Flavobacteriaceae bacterium]MDG1830515.1 RecX family transcriptional regulator [Flavobacteriaceae bacterium]